MICKKQSTRFGKEKMRFSRDSDVYQEEASLSLQGESQPRLGGGGEWGGGRGEGGLRNCDETRRSSCTICPSWVHILAQEQGHP